MVVKKVLTNFKEQFKIINVPNKVVDKATETRYNNKRLKKQKALNKYAFLAQLDRATPF